MPGSCEPDAAPTLAWAVAASYKLRSSEKISLIGMMGGFLHEFRQTRLQDEAKVNILLFRLSS